MSIALRRISLFVKATFETIKSWIWFLVAIYILKFYSRQTIVIEWWQALIFMIFLGIFEYFKAKKETTEVTMDKTVNDIVEKYKDNDDIKNLGAEIIKAMPEKQRKEILNTLPKDQREKLEEYLKDDSERRE